MVNVLTNILKNDRLDVYPLFKKFCSLKEKGFRKESFKALSSFIDEERCGVIMRNRILLVGCLLYLKHQMIFTTYSFIHWKRNF